MVSDAFVIAQRYVTALLLFLGAALWFRLRMDKKTGAVKSSKVISAVMLLFIPAVLGSLSIIPDDISGVITALLNLIILAFALYLAVKHVSSVKKGMQIEIIKDEKRQVPAVPAAKQKVQIAAPVAVQFGLKDVDRER
ncbi:MAG: hypothetical protein AABW87_00185 [Nanoarchaeota archaeon]